MAEKTTSGNKSTSDTREDVTELNVHQFCEYLAAKFDTDVVESFRSNKISGSIFLRLSEEQLGKMVTAIGDVVQLSTLQAKILVSHHFSLNNCLLQFTHRVDNL